MLEKMLEIQVDDPVYVDELVHYYLTFIENKC
jgi:hypothetical protein